MRKKKKENKTPMKNIFTCDICNRIFSTQQGLASHRRWHDLPEYEHFHNNRIEKLSNAGKKSKGMTGKKHSEITKEKIKNKLKGQKRPTTTGILNPNWKGEEASYNAIHVWIRNRKPKPEQCEKCGKQTKNLECANISGLYKRNISDYIYLCKICHKTYDGVLDRFIEGGKKTRFKKGLTPWSKGKKRSPETTLKIKEAWKRKGLTSLQKNIIQLLLLKGQLRQNEIIKILKRAESTIHQSLAKLEKENIIEKIKLKPDSNAVFWKIYDNSPLLLKSKQEIKVLT